MYLMQGLHVSNSNILYLVAIAVFEVVRTTWCVDLNARFANSRQHTGDIQLTDVS